MVEPGWQDSRSVHSCVTTLTQGAGMRIGGYLASVGWAAMAAATPLAAQAPVGETPDTRGAAQPTGAKIYDSAFFATYSPRNALDIVRQVPGFALDVGNSDIRGFAGAAGNVVINGARPSSKAESLDSVLAQIPARRVVRVELGSGSLFGSDYSGKTQVLNIILSADSGFDATVTGSLRRRFTGVVTPNLSASASLKRGNSTFAISGGTENQDTFDEGTDFLTDPFTGELFEKRAKLNHYRPHNPYISGSWALEQGADKAIHLNGRFQRSTEDFVQTNRVYPVGAPERDDRLYQTLTSPGFEIGGDISRPVAGGTVKLVALANRRHRETLDTSLKRIESDVIGGTELSSDSQRNETIGRLTWSRANLGGFSFETGAEVAFNSLESQVGYFEFGPDGERKRIDLPVDDATVREKRAEPY
ncbi:MAG: Plug domain-containing protein, partial [Sphingomicrobium sp.]